MGAASDKARPGAVLFACTLNSVRSPMAEALMKHLYGTAIFVDSAGVECAELDPFVLEVLNEVGYERKEHHAKSLDDLQDHAFDLIIALTPEARDKAEEVVEGEAVTVEYWPVSDPTQEGGSRAQRLDAYRRLRDDLIARMKERFGGKAAAAG
ncbi:MAG: arsenate reductase ArsC [Parvibaculaceae bacterium]